MAPAQRRTASANDPGAAPDRKAKSRPGRRPTPIRALIIDDDEDDLIVIMRCLAQLSSFEVEIHQASSLEDARSAVKDHLFDIALVDFHLGDDTGTHVMQELGGRTSEIAFIFLTGEQDERIKRQALEAGALHLIGKTSLNPEILQNAIHSSLHAQKIEIQLNDALVELERATRSRSDFFAKIGHDLKTPLNSVIGYSDAMLQEAFGPLGDPKYREYAEAVREAGTHLLELIENLIRFSAGDRQETAFVECDLNELAASAIRMTDPHRRKRGHTLVRHLADKPVLVSCQASAITQATINLLTNAIKYSGQDGAIDVSVRENGRYAEVAISDNGIGMSQDDISVALQPFGRVQLPAEKAQEGTGLGLHIVREIMARHRGQLDVSSAPGNGTTAILRLPLRRDGKKKSQAANTPG